MQSLIELAEAAPTAESAFELDRLISVDRDRFTLRTLGEVAEFFGVDEQTVRTWRLKTTPMPGEPGRWPLREIVRWRFARMQSSTMRDAHPARRRVDLARAEKLEIEAEILKGKYIPATDATQEFMAMAAAVRSELEAIPAAIKNDLPEPVRESVGRELRNMIRQALRRLANKGSAFTGGTE